MPGVRGPRQHGSGDARLPQQRVLEIGGVRIGLIHGWGPPAGLAERVRAAFADTPLDCLVFGHSHVPLCQREGALLLSTRGAPPTGAASRAPALVCWRSRTGRFKGGLFGSTAKCGRISGREA